MGAGVSVPHELVGPGFVATPLTVEHLVADHAAYVASPDVIRAHSHGRWPVEGFTVDDDRELVERHEADHRAGRAFTFALLDGNRSASLGCLYLIPLRPYLERVGAAAKLVRRTPESAPIAAFWVRQDLRETRLVEDLVASVDRWLIDDWPVPSHLFRILPEERASRRALEQLGLRRVTLALPDEDRPFLWFG